MSSANKRPTPNKKAAPDGNQTVGVIFGVSLVVAMVVMGLFAYAIGREMGTPPAALYETTTPVPGFTPQLETEQAGEKPSPTPTQDVDAQSSSPLKTPRIQPTLTPWDGKERVTVLIMGLDYRDWVSHSGASRTDTMMLLTMDPITKTAGMLSVPRDLWVPIPGFSHAKINTAHVLGEINKLPGGGPGLAVETVERVIGVPINYYAIVDFQAFIRFIDELGGVKLEIPYEIEVDLLNGNNKVIQPGVHTLPGDYALAYARNRTAGHGDFDRARRQQQVILGIRDRILDYKMLPDLIDKAPTLYQELVSGVATNMKLDEVIRLALLAQKIPNENIRQGVIDTKYVAYGWSPDNLSILIPYPDRIRLLRDEIFSSSGTMGPLAPGSETDRMAMEGATIAIRNGTDVEDLAERTAAYLTSQGASVVEVGATDQRFVKTTLVDYVGRPYTLQYLVSWLGVETRHIEFNYDPNHPVDVEIILGDDWVSKENLP